MSLTFDRRKLAIVDGIEPSRELIRVASFAAFSVAVLIPINSDDGSQNMHGTAVCVDSSGLFLTTHHYVASRRALLVLDREYAAEAVASDDEEDLILFAVREPLNEMPTPVHFASTMPDRGAPVLGLGHVQEREHYRFAAYGAHYLDRLAEVCDPASGAAVPQAWLDCALVFSGSHLSVPGFSGGSIIKADGSVVALTSFGDGDSCVVGPSGAAASALVQWYRKW